MMKSHVSILVIKFLILSSGLIVLPRVCGWIGTQEFLGPLDVQDEILGIKV